VQYKDILIPHSAV